MILYGCWMIGKKTKSYFKGILSIHCMKIEWTTQFKDNRCFFLIIWNTRSRRQQDGSEGNGHDLIKHHHDHQYDHWSRSWSSTWYEALRSWQHHPCQHHAPSPQPPTSWYHLEFREADRAIPVQIGGVWDLIPQVGHDLWEPVEAAMFLLSFQHHYFCYCY